MLHVLFVKCGVVCSLVCFRVFTAGMASAETLIPRLLRWRYVSCLR